MPALFGASIARHIDIACNSNQNKSAQNDIMFSTNRQCEPITESKNVSAWESLILDLSESTTGEDNTTSDGKEEKGGGGVHNGRASSSLPLSTRSGNTDDEIGQKIQRLPQLLTNIHHDTTSAKASDDGGEKQTPTALESPSKLKDWMAYHSTTYAPHANHMGRKMDAVYTLKAAQVALSLAKYLGRQFEQEKDMDVESRREDLPSISFEDIVVDNVIVTNVDSEAVLESTSSPGGATKNNGGVNSERRQVLALGMILYELFTQGTPPPTRLQQSLKSSGRILSFGTSLRISEQSKEEEDDDRNASGGDRRKNKDDDDDDDDMDEADQQEESFVRKQRRRRCDENVEEESVSKFLKLAGVPISICKLISDMMSNRDDTDIGGLFQCDKSVSCFTEVIMDLEQMVDQPKDFLYDTIRLNAKPTVRNKLYCRHAELEQGIELAGRCAMDTSSSLQQEVLMITGLSGEQRAGLFFVFVVLLNLF